MGKDSSLQTTTVRFWVFLLLAVSFYYADAVATAAESFSGNEVNTDGKLVNGELGKTGSEDHNEEEKFKAFLSPKPILKKPFFKFPPKVPIVKKPIPIVKKVEPLPVPLLKKPIPTVEKHIPVKKLEPLPVPLFKKSIPKPIPIVEKPIPKPIPIVKKPKPLPIPVFKKPISQPIPVVKKPFPKPFPIPQKPFLPHSVPSSHYILS